MKRFWFLVMVLVPVLGLGQDTTAVIREPGVHSDSLKTGTRDSVLVVFGGGLHGDFSFARNGGELGRAGRGNVGIRRG